MLDSGNEANLAIGTTSADELVSGTSYYYIYNLKGSNGTESMYKISAQEGHYLFLIPSTMTTFAESTAHLIPFKSGYTAPETRSWYTEVEPNYSVALADSRYTAQWLSGVLSDSNDVDYVKINLSGETNIRFICPSNVDYDITIYDDSGNSITGLYETNSEQVKTYVFPTGEYYFKIYSYRGSSTTDIYWLIVE